MDTVKLEIPLDFITTLVHLTWRELLFGVENELISPSTAVDFAIEALDRVGESPRLAELATQTSTESIVWHVKELAKSEPEQQLDAIKEKWLYVVLAWVYERRAEFSDAFQLVEQIYADFDYPREIISFVRYMPMEGPDLGSISNNEDRLRQNWKRYLHEQAEKHGSLDVAR